MKTKNFENFKENRLNSDELYNILGGRIRRGPGDLVVDDVDMPELTLAPGGGPGDLVVDDVDMPELTLAPVSRRSFRRFNRNMGIF